MQHRRNALEHIFSDTTSTNATNPNPNSTNAMNEIDYDDENLDVWGAGPLTVAEEGDCFTGMEYQMFG